MEYIGLRAGKYRIATINKHKQLSFNLQLPIIFFSTFSCANIFLKISSGFVIIFVTVIFVYIQLITAKLFV